MLKNFFLSLFGDDLFYLLRTMFHIGRCVYHQEFQTITHMIPFPTFSSVLRLCTKKKFLSNVLRLPNTVSELLNVNVSITLFACVWCVWMFVKFIYFHIKVGLHIFIYIYISTGKTLVWCQKVILNKFKQKTWNLFGLLN